MNETTRTNISQVVGVSPADSNCAAGIVTYNPEIERFKVVLEAISHQVSKVYIDDNGSDNIATIKAVASDYVNVQICEEGENVGIAAALNHLCTYAIQEGYDWLLTLDHDTICSSNLIQSFEELAGIEDAGIICPRVHYVGYSPKEKGNIEERYSEVSACMTSGSLMRLSAYQKTAGFDEWMFIDYVDNDICMKLRIAGYKILRDNRVFMDHKLGHVETKKVLFINLHDFNYSPMRLYYISRNSIYFSRKYMRHINYIKHFLINAQRIVVYTMLYRKDAEKWRAVKAGIREGLSKQV